MTYSGYSALAIDHDAHPLFDVPNQTGTPERNLLLAILERAILDFVGNDEVEVESSSEWLFESDEEQMLAFSFRWVCHHLDLDHRSVRDRIRSMPKRGSRKIAPWYFKTGTTNN